MILNKRKEKVVFNPLEYCKRLFTPGTVFNNSKIIDSVLDNYTIDKKSWFYTDNSGDVMVELGGRYGAFTLYSNGKYAEIISKE